jgi:hypothetical protein
VAFFHIFRLAGVLACSLATYDFIAVFIQDRRWRRLGTALVCLGGGLGWLHFLGLGGLWAGGTPLEFYSPETFGFLMLYGLPHLAFTRAFLLWGLRLYLHPDPGLSAWQSSLRVGLVWLGIGSMQPLTIVSGWAVITAYMVAITVWQVWESRFGRGADWSTWWSYFRRAVWTAFLSAPMVIYTFLVFQLDPFLKGWQRQNIILSPQFSHYLLAFGMLLPLAILGIRPLLRDEKWKSWLVIGWVVIFPLLAYAPYNLQRRLPEGVWAAVIILFLKWIESGTLQVQRWAPRWAFLSFVSTIFIVTGGVMTAWSVRAPIFVSASVARAYEFLAQPGGSAEQVVLASYQTSNALPAWAPVRVVIGHGPESINGPELRKDVECFYQTSCTDAFRTRFIRELGVQAVLWGPNEKQLGDWDPRSAPFLEQVYHENDDWVFRVKQAW